jgi:hypothetical protein
MATFTSTSERITIDGEYKDFTGGSGNTTTVIQYASGDAPVSGDAGRFLLWKNGSNTGFWEVRFIASATSSTVTVTDGGFSSAPPSGSTFVISTNLDDIDAAFSNSVVRKEGRSFQIRNRDFELTNGAFVADVNASINTKSTQTGSGFIGTYPVANGCVLQFGRLIGGEANNSVETIGGCNITFEISNNTLIFTTQGSANSSGCVVNFYGCLVESIGNGFSPFIRASGPMRIVGCIADGPMGGRLYSTASELVDTRFSGNVSGGVAWSLGATFTRPINNVFFYQNNTAIKAFEGFQGTFTNVTFADSNINIIDSSGARSGLLFTFIDCTTFPDNKITHTKGKYKQGKSINYTLTNSAGVGLTGAKVAVYDNAGAIQDGIKTSASGAVDTINAVFFDRPHGSTSTNKAPFDIRIREYGYTYLGFQSAVSESIKQEVRLADNTTLVSTEAQAAAITGISLNFSTETVTITQDADTQKLYDYYQYQLAQTANMAYGEDLVRTGDSFNLDDWDMAVDGCTYTGDATTTGLITLLNGGVFNGERTDANGTVLAPRSVSITGLVAGSTLRVYNTTTSTQVVNQVVAGTSYTATYAEGVGYSVGDVLELRVAKINKLEFTTSVIPTSAGWSALVSQEDNPTYAAHGKDGSTVTGISWDSGNMQFDFNEADNVIDGPDIGAWYYYFITTSTGIAEAFGALSWPQVNRMTNITSKVAITWDNTKSTPLQINNLWVDRDDGVSIIASGSNSIQINPPAVFVQGLSDIENNTKLIPALL